MPAPVFRGLLETSFTVFGTPTRVTELISPEWEAFWCKEIASVDSEIFYRWAIAFVKVVRDQYGLTHWLVLFYDVCR